MYIWDLATLLWLSISLSALFYDTFAVEYKMPSQKEKKSTGKRTNCSIIYNQVTSSTYAFLS